MRMNAAKMKLKTGNLKRVIQIRLISEIKNGNQKAAMKI